jgi:hypothetical protein
MKDTAVRDPPRSLRDIPLWKSWHKLHRQAAVARGLRSRSFNSVGIAWGYGLDSSGSIFGGGKVFSLPYSIQTGSGASCPVSTVGSFLGAKSRRAGEWSWSFTYTLCQVQDGRRYTFIPLYIFMSWCLIQYRNNFTITFPLKHYG